MKLELLGFAWRGKDILLMTNKGEAKLSVGDFERLLTLAPSAKRYEASLARLAVFAILRQPNAKKMVAEMSTALRR